MVQQRSRLSELARAGALRLATAVSAIVLALAFFLVLPLMQSIHQPPVDDLIVQGIDTAAAPPPPPPPPEEEPEEEEQEEEPPPPELEAEAVPLDLSQLELALNPPMGDGWLGGDFQVKLGASALGGESSEEVDALFSIADLDQKPRVVYQPGPVLSADVRRKAPGTVYVLFVVDQDGRVAEPLVQKSTDPAFERPALSAVKQWKFEPGKRNGQAVRFRMRVPITFPES